MPHLISAATQSGFVGLGTVLNVATVVVGSLAGMVVGNRLTERTRSVVTDCLGLTTLLMAMLSAWSVTDPALKDAVGSGAPMLIVLGSLLVGSIIGTTLRIEDRLEGLAGTIQTWVARRSRTSTVAAQASSEGSTDGSTAGASTADARPIDERERFIEGWLTASLLFCVGPLTILGSISDGLGRGIDQLALKSVLDGFAALAFASSFGIGVLLSAASVAVIQGALTLLGWSLGSVLPDAHISALTATGGLMLVAISLRLLRIRDIPVGDLLPALIAAPLLTQLVVVLR